jgi:hypothetical protein
MNNKMKSWTVSWLSLKTKVELGLRGTRVMSGDWRRLHRVCGVSGGSPENHWVSWLIHKAKTEAGAAAVLTVKIRQPSHEFTFGVGMSFIPYPLVLTPVV